MRSDLTETPRIRSTVYHNFPRRKITAILHDEIRKTPMAAKIVKETLNGSFNNEHLQIQVEGAKLVTIP